MTYLFKYTKYLSKKIQRLDKFVKNNNCYSFNPFYNPNKITIIWIEKYQDK